MTKEKRREVYTINSPDGIFSPGHLFAVLSVRVPDSIINSVLFEQEVDDICTA